MMKKTLLFLLLTCFSLVFAQSVGDYRSKAVGLWNSNTTWQVYNGSIWEDVTSGYPGVATMPVAGSSTSTVTITHTVTIPASMDDDNNKVINLSFGNLIIQSGINPDRIGNLFMDPYEDTTINFVTTMNVLIDYGKMTFASKKMYVKFPEGAQIIIKTPNGKCDDSSTGINGYGIIVDPNTPCTNNVELWIGDVTYTTCTGNGGQPIGGNFCDVNTAGGTVKAFATLSSLCIGESVGLSTQDLKGATYLWTLVSGPDQIIPVSGVQNRTVTLTPTMAGTYVFKIAVTRNGKTVSDQISIKVGESSIYIGGGVWSNGKPDTNNRYSAVIASDYTTATSGGSFTACSCTVNAGKTLTISPNTYVSLEGSLINNGAAENVVIESDGNLVQVKDGIMNSGNITSKSDILVGAARNQYNYLGTPVNFATGESFKTIYPGTTFVLYHNETNNFFYNSSGVNIPGRGLAVKEPTGSGAATVTATYKGVPQNGIINIGVTNKNTNVTTFGYNLLGNPYPSNIDLQKLYNINGGNVGAEADQVVSPHISATFYFWNNNGNTIFQQMGSGYDGQAYAIFNVLTGPTGTGTKSQLSPKLPSNLVKVGQGFMTRSLETNYNFLFNNSIRTKDIPAVDFLGKGNTDVQVDRYWLQMTATSGITSTIAIVHYASGNDFFGPEDSRMMGGSDALYSISEGEKLAIDGRSSFQNTMVIPLGIQSFATGNYTLGVDVSEGIFANGQSIYLKDTQTGIITNLSEGSHTFAATAGESTGRFEILYQPETVLATAGSVKEEVMVYRDGNEFVVRSASKKITVLEVYDGSGRMVYGSKPHQTETRIDASIMTNGIYLVKIDQGGAITTKKILK